MEINQLVPYGILLAIVGWLFVDRLRAKDSKDKEQDIRLDKLTDAINDVYKLLTTIKSDLEWLMKAK